MLTDEELQAIAARQRDWRRSTGSGKQWHAARLAKEDVPALLATVAELGAALRQAEAALQGTEQVA
jgi:hypothetical protein